MHSVAIAACLNPFGQYIWVGMPASSLSRNNLSVTTSRVNIVPPVQVIAAKAITEVYDKVVRATAT